MENAIAILRVSSTKQGLQGDSPDDQLKQIEFKTKLLNVKIAKVFEFVQSASGEIQPSQKAIDYCKENKGKIKYAVIKSIDRFTRGGSSFYDHLNSQLIKYGVMLVDVHGVIGMQTVNTLAYLNVEYNWSKFSPTRQNELLTAESAKDEVRNILTRLIGAEINFTRLGYPMGPARMGYTSEKVYTDNGLRVIWKPHPIEAPWFIRMFELRIQGNLADDEIVKEINALGYKSRKRRKFDPEDRSKVIAYTGEVLLDVDQLQRYVQDPIYAGMLTHQWNGRKPIKAKFQGLVTVDMFNKANHGKAMIIENSDGTVEVLRGKVLEWRLRKLKENPDYPYKQYVLCPTCSKPLLGSASRGKSGKYHPAYHCGRGHYFRVAMKDFSETIQNFVSKVDFTDEFKERFKEIFIEEWNKRERSASNDTIVLNKRLIAIEQEIQLIKDKIKILNSVETIRSFEDDIEKLRQEKAELTVRRDNKEDEQLDIQILLNCVVYFMEHLQDLLIGSPNPFQNAAMFGLLFDLLPTYNDLINGTPNLACLFKLNDAYTASKSDLVNVYEKIRTFFKTESC